MIDRTTLLFAKPGFRVLNVTLEPDAGRLVLVESVAKDGGCPSCEVMSSRIKERPICRLKDLPHGSVPLRLWVQDSGHGERIHAAGEGRGHPHSGRARLYRCRSTACWVSSRVVKANRGHRSSPPSSHRCPHPNACLTCPDFLTTAEFLPVRQQQAELTQELFDAAQSTGRQRQADNHRKVLVSLDKIIGSLQALRTERTDNA